MRKDMTRRPLQRFYGRGDLHFITFSCYRRSPYLKTIRERNRLVKTLHEVRLYFGFALVGYVVMPEHVHLLMGEPAHANPSKVLQALKQRVSRGLRRKGKCGDAQLPLKFGEERNDGDAFWQRRFYDFNVWTERKLREKLDYMHRNPVERKLVTRPQDWPWSSYSHYANKGRGLIAIDSVRPR